MNRATAIVITSITSFVVFMISFPLLVKFFNPMKAAFALAIVPRVAKVITDQITSKNVCKRTQQLHGCLVESFNVLGVRTQ